MTDTEPETFFPGRLQYRTYFLDESQFPAAWGARTILDNRGIRPHVDIVPDRVDTFGSDEDKKRLFAHLEEHLDRKTLDELVGALHLRGSDDEGHVILDDDVVQVTVSCQGSHGYLYITAGLKR